LAFSYSTLVPAPKPERVPPDDRRRASLGTVLVVEDDPLMRLFVVRALEGGGYDTLDAESAERGLELLHTHGSAIRLLLSDVKLPGASGAQLCQRAHELWPELPTLLMSGSVKPFLVSEQLIGRDADVLHKPFRIADLLTKVEQLLAPQSALTVRG